MMAEIIRSGLTQTEIAQLLGKSQSWVSKVLNGEYADLTYGDGQSLRRLHVKIRRQTRVAA